MNSQADVDAVRQELQPTPNGINGTENIKEVVKQKYGEAALRVKSGGSSCCGAAATTSCCDPITTNLYDASQAGQIRSAAAIPRRWRN
jgi:hypothetical protein